MQNKKITSVLVVIALILSLSVAYVFFGQAYAGAPGSTGNGIDPQVETGNPTCEDLGYQLGFKPSPEPPPNGIYSDGVLDITISNNDGTYFDWSSNIGVDAVLVKGGADTNHYVYDPPTESTGDTHLHSPVNPNNQLPHGLSHMEFCYDIVPSVDVEKTGDELSKIGDEINYTFTITNDGDLTIDLVSITDIGDGWDGLGDLSGEENDCLQIAVGDFCEFTVPYTVQNGDPDPLENTVIVIYDGVLPNQDPFEVSDDDDHSVNLFQPSITFDKTGNALSKIGDTVSYTITLNNTSSDDSPNLTCTITDALLGIDENTNLAPGANHIINTNYQVQQEDDDPLVNTAFVSCQVDGFPNILEDNDSHEVELAQPSVTIDKTGNDFSKHGDTVDYTITVTNTSSQDSPMLDCTLTDALLGINKVINDLAPGDVDITNEQHLVQEPPDPDPLLNTASLSCVVQELGNVLNEDDGHEVDLVHPDFTVTKDCLTETVPPGGTAIFEVEITNTGDVPLDFTTNEAEIPPFSLDPAQMQTFEVTQEAGQEGIVENEVIVLATLPEEFNLANVLEKSAADQCEIGEDGGATRTPGFWRTHFDYTTHIFDDHLGGSVDLGWKTLNSIEDVFGMFWSHRAKESDGGRRNKVCKVRVLGSYHLLSAIFNSALDNGATVPIDPETQLDLITAMQDALDSGDKKEILRLVTLLDDYNNSGDDIAIIDNDGEPIGNADPNDVKDIANFAAGDC